MGDRRHHLTFRHIAMNCLMVIPHLIVIQLNWDRQFDLFVEIIMTQSGPGISTA